MGLDMFAWAIDPEKCKTATDILCEYKDEEEYRPEELHYWRKHHDLHGWMENLYVEKGGTEEFNCQRVRLVEEDLDALEQDLIANKLPHTTGFFFGDNPPDEETLNDDLLFIAKAREAIKEGKLVYYDSWW